MDAATDGNGDPDCPNKCIYALDKLRKAFAAIELLTNTKETWKEIVGACPTIVALLGLCDVKHECPTIIDCKLIALSLISGVSTKIGMLLNQKRYCDVQIKWVISENRRNRELNGLYASLQDAETVSFLYACLGDSNKFVRYKASKLFLEYFSFHPCALVTCKDAAIGLLSSCMKNNRYVFMSLLLSVMKCCKKTIKWDDSSSDFLYEGNLSSQMEVLKMLFQVCNDILKKGNSPGGCDSQDPADVTTLKAIYQAKKLELPLLSRGKQEPVEETQQMWEDLSKHLSSFLELYPINWKQILTEEEFLRFATFYKLKILFFKLNSPECMIQQAIEFLTCFIERSECLMHIDFTLRHGFGGSLLAGNFDKKLTIAEMTECSQITPNLRLFVLVTLKCFCLVLEANEYDILQVALNLIEKVCGSLSALLLKFFAKESELKPVNVQFDEIPSNTFPSLLVAVMLDEDDQLCLCLENVLQICIKATNLASKFGADSACNRIFDATFPHKLFHSFLEEISFDHLICIDWLISDETCFISNLQLYLGIILSDFNTFTQTISRICHEEGTGKGSIKHRSPQNDFVYKPVVDSLLRAESLAKASHLGVSSPTVDMMDEDHLQSSGYPQPRISNGCTKNDVEACNVDDRELESTKGDTGIALKSEQDMQLDVQTLSNKEASRCSSDLAERTNEVLSLVDYSSSESDDGDHNSFEDVSETGRFIASSSDLGLVSTSCGERSLINHDKYSSIGASDGSEDVMQPYAKEHTRFGNKGMEDFMDFFIRLRLKLDKIEELGLSSASFKEVLSLLRAVEEKYDSLC